MQSLSFRLRSLIPVLILVVLCAGAGFTAYHGGVPFVGGVDAQRVVTFDISRLTNAQRAIAAGLIQGDDPDVVVTLARIGKEVEGAIVDIAGPGALVVVKQAIISGQAEDITDAVLARLGLPTDVPTLDPMNYVTDIAPTELTGALSEHMSRQREQRAGQFNRDMAEQYRGKVNDAVLP